MPACLFDTAIGRCAIAWSPSGVHRIQLPKDSDERTLRQTGAEEAEQPPDWIEAAVERMAGLLRGAPDPLTDIPVDLEGVPSFARTVYLAAREIPPGRTIGYGELAAKIGEPSAAQAVGRALGDNPCPIILPCHRILAADGSMHGFSANGGVHTKRRMLTIEGALEPALFEL